jgi:hypothetical protein
MVGNINVQQIAETQDDKELGINAATLKLDKALTASYTADLTSGNATITDLQGEEAIRIFADNATVAGRTITLPVTIRLLLVHSDVGNTQMVQVIIGSTTIDVFPGNAVLLYSDGTTNGMFRMANGFEEISHFEIGVPPVTTTLYQKVITRPCSLDDQFVGSRAFAGTAPSGGAVVYNVQKNGSTIGTISFADTATTATFATTASVVETLAVGDRISIDSPSNLFTMADVSFNLQAQRSD